MSNQYGPNAKIGHKRTTSHGYVEVKVGKDHHLSNVNGYAYEHRIVAEKKLRRKLKKGEMIHHVDGKRKNNIKENIEVVKGIAGHKVHHRYSGKRRRNPGERNRLVKCACGCGERLKKFDSSGRYRKFISGHIKTNTGKFYLNNKAVYCACGCGEQILRYDKYGRIRKFISGHNGRIV